MTLTDEQLIARAREYLSDKVLDLADVPKFIELLVKVWDKHHVQPSARDVSGRCDTPNCWCQGRGYK